MNEKQEKFIREYFHSLAMANSQYIDFQEDEVCLDGWFTSEQLFSIAETMKKIEEQNNESN